jgi:vacuolar protein sorting-associated protein 13D
VRLEPTPDEPLACINFIKSRLLIETYSDLSQDIDLVSQVSAVALPRYSPGPLYKKLNMYCFIESAN